MIFKELLELMYVYVKFTSKELPMNCYNIATQQLNIVIKNSLQCKNDYKTNSISDTPLRDNEAIYTLYKGEYTIYYDEKNPYSNFFIAHEIAHHLLNHRSDDINKHHDANLMAAMIVAPPHLIKKNKIHNSLQLAMICKIPSEVAEIYWKAYKKMYLQSCRYTMLKYAGIIFSIAILTLGCIFIGYRTINLIHTQNGYNNVQSEVRKDAENDTLVYVTKSGRKYHAKYCIYIKDKSNVTKISVDDAEILGYEKCNVCFQG